MPIVNAFTLPTRKLCIGIVVLACCLLFAASSCSRNGADKTVSNPRRNPGTVIFELSRELGYPSPGDPSIYGLIAKLWDDGTLLRSTDPDKPSRKYQLGSVQADKLADLLRAIDEIALATSNADDPLVPIDMATIELLYERPGARLYLVEPHPVPTNTALFQIRDRIFRLQLNDLKEVDDPNIKR